MSRLVEEISLRDRTYVFRDRNEAGRLLAEKLGLYENSDGIVFGIPSGGVPVASEISNALHVPMDLIIVRKIQIPQNPEAGFGALNPDGEMILNERLLNQLGLSGEVIRNQVNESLDVIRQRNRLFRGERPFPGLEGKPVIVVDDGLASGYTMLAAVRFLKKKAPQKVIVAVPTGSRRTIDFLLPETDELICLNVRSGYPFAVADAYRNWYDLSDKEVLTILQRIIDKRTIKGGSVA
jgi:predicted phosphoribosyltransferase